MGKYTGKIMLVIGILVTALGPAVVAHYSFRSNVWMVFNGFLLFTVGYKMSWYATHTIDNLEDLKNGLKRSRNNLADNIHQNLSNYLLMIAGILSASYGVTIFVSTIQSFSVQQGMLAGVFVFGGYVLSHEGVNKVLV